MLTRLRILGPITVLCLGLVACSSAPDTFRRTRSPGWKEVEIMGGLSYDQAWEACIDTLVRRFDLTVIQKDSGYARTNWLYTWYVDEDRQDYRVRVTLKFSGDKSKVAIKTEAEYGGSGEWIQGTDSALLEDIYGDLSGKLGRVRR